MTVYVDQIQEYSLDARARGLRWTHWCHLTADTRYELHRFAVRLGLKWDWFQILGPGSWHYELVPLRREQAVRLGAVEIDHHEFAAIVARRRADLAAARALRGNSSGNERVPDPVIIATPEETTDAH